VESFVSVYAVKVDVDHSVYVLRDMDLSTRHEKCVRITRDDQGAYHLDLGGVDYQFEAKDLESQKRYGLVVPIESVSGIAERR
jgi:hypothetical protein